MTEPSHSPASPITVRGSPDTGWQTLARTIRLSNQTGTLLLMLPPLWALTLASEGKPPLHLIVIFAAGSFLMRSAGVVVNDLADRSFDRRVARTRSRPLASGALSVPQAFAIFGVLVAAAAGLLLLLNPLTQALSPVALLLAVLYPYAKRVIPLPQVVLGAAFGWGAVMAWAAARNTLEAPVWLLYGATVLWALAYDTIYALQDKEDDARIGVKSAALYFGRRLWIAVGVSLAIMLGLLAVAGWMIGLGAVFYGTLAAVAGFATQQMRRLRSEIAPLEAFALFRQHVWIGAAILGGIWAGFF
jgi:4-hydroxybenzoate polyprenyltransferase